MVLCFLLYCDNLYAENIDPNSVDDQYAYGENIGWLNAEPLGDGGDGIEVLPDKLLGWMYGENIGWVNFDTASGFYVSTANGTIYACEGGPTGAIITN